MKDPQEEQGLYLLGWIFIILLIIFILLFYIFPGISRFVLTPCVFRSLTGLYCPGCGGSRSIQYLLRGEIIKSIVYHPFVFYGGGLFILYMSTQTLARMTRGRIHGLPYRDFYIYAGVGLVVFNLILKNLLLINGIELLK